MRMKPLSKSRLCQESSSCFQNRRAPSGRSGRRANFDRQASAVAFVEHVERAEPAPAVEGVMHEIYRRDLVQRVGATSSSRKRGGTRRRARRGTFSRSAQHTRDRQLLPPGPWLVRSSQLSLAWLVPCRQPEARRPHPSSPRSACRSQSRECTTPSAFRLSCPCRRTIPSRYTRVRP